MFYGNEAAIELERDTQSLFTLEVVAFLDRLHNHFEDKRRALLKNRNTIDKKSSTVFKGMQPNVTPVPKNIYEDGIEVTSPAYKQMMIQAFYAKANLFTANFETNEEISWKQLMKWQQNLYDAIHRQNSFSMPESDQIKLAVRPRSLDKVEKNLTKEGEPMSASFVDFGIFMFHNTKTLLKQGRKPHVYLGNIQNHLEARLWNDVFIYTQNDLQIPQGSIHATLINEHVTDEEELSHILYELNDHTTTIYYTI